LFCNNS